MSFVEERPLPRQNAVFAEYTSVAIPFSHTIDCPVNTKAECRPSDGLDLRSLSLRIATMLVTLKSQTPLEGFRRRGLVRLVPRPSALASDWGRGTQEPFISIPS
jgi:hypothetical protein